MSLLVPWLAGWLLLQPPGPAVSTPLRDIVSGQHAVQPAPGGSSVTAPAGHRDAPGRLSQGERVEQSSPDRLVYRARIDVPVTVGATAAWIVAEANKTRLAAVTCRWCDRAPDGTDTLNTVDSWGRRALRWDNSGRAITLSNATAFVFAPAAAYGLEWKVASRDGRGAETPANWILITQSMAIAADATEVMKFVIGRERPFVHALAPGSPATSPSSADNNTSFPSGHTTLAFSLAMSSWEVASLRGYRKAAWLLGAGIPLATLTAYFRVAADRHYLTDVLAGAAVGSAVGFGVPYLAHRRRTDHRVPAVRVIPAAGGEMLAAQWTW